MAALAAACLLTVIIETTFFILLGYRGREDIVIVALTNVSSNLLLNSAIAFLWPDGPGWRILPLEMLVVGAEYVVFAKAFGPSRRLFLQTFAANCLSYGIGAVLIWYHIWVF